MDQIFTIPLEELERQEAEHLEGAEALDCLWMALAMVEVMFLGMLMESQ